MNKLLELPISKAELKQRIKWFINLRWVAVIALFITTTATKYILDINLPLFPIYFGNLLLIFYNIFFSFYNQKLNIEIDEEIWIKNANRFANLQISLDLIMLSYLIHFSGGIENPFIFYFIFHMVIASIFLSNKAAYLQATLSIILFGIIGIGEYLNFLPHYHLHKFISENNDKNLYYILGIFSVFSTTLYLTVYMATSIVNKLRFREKELANANKQLAEQDRLKSQYVLAVSHDIQSPLSTIQNCLKVVLDGLTGKIPDKAQEMVSRAEQRVANLLSFVKDLLNLSRIRASYELDKKDFNYKELIEKTIEQLNPLAKSKNISIEGQLQQNTSLIYANYDALVQLLTNLITNAIRYTPNNNKIGIQFKEHSTKKGCFHTVVWDTGIGISDYDKPKIFDEFYRAKNAQEIDKDGTGLGLSIVKEIIKTHNGVIWLESQPEKGSKFIFTISNNYKCSNCPENRIF